MAPSLPLAGIKVIALEQAVAAPFASRQLADLGAEVIKIERPGSGDFARDYDETVNGLCSHFVWLNRSKQSLTLNMKHATASDIMAGLLADADVFIQNLAPGAAERLGLGSAALREHYPKLIICNISGYGSSGPYRDKKAYDLLVQCETGLVSITGTPDTPAKTGISTADIAAGMYAYSGILTALFQRERNGGDGTVLDVSLFDALGEWMSFPAYFAAYGGKPPARTGASHAAIVPYGPFAAKDGRQVNLGLQNEREWVRFCEQVLRKPEFIKDPRFATNALRVANRDEFHAEANAIFSELSLEDIVQRLDEAQIANARMNDMQAFWDHRQHQARNRWRQVDTAAGPIQALAPPVIMENVEARMDPIPEIGEHTAAILQNLGYSAEEIESLHNNGAV